MSGSFFNGVQMWIINTEGKKKKCHVVPKCIKYIFSAATFKNAFGIDVKGCLYSASLSPAMWEQQLGDAYEQQQLCNMLSLAYVNKHVRIAAQP